MNDCHNINQRRKQIPVFKTRTWSERIIDLNFSLFSKIFVKLRRKLTPMITFFVKSLETQLYSFNHVSQFDMPQFLVFDFPVDKVIGEISS